jgi:hypothetical protein
MPRRHREADRTTPVLHHQRRPAQVEFQDQILDHLRVFRGGVSVAGGRLRQTESRIIDCDTTVSVPQAGDHVPVQERPGRVAVQQDQRRPGTLVEVMHPRPVDVFEVTGERV